MFGFLEWCHKKRLLLNRLLLWRGVDVFFLNLDIHGLLLLSQVCPCILSRFEMTAFILSSQITLSQRQTTHAFGATLWWFVLDLGEVLQKRGTFTYFACLEYSKPVKVSSETQTHTLIFHLLFSHFSQGNHWIHLFLNWYLSDHVSCPALHLAF